MNPYDVNVLNKDTNLFSLQESILNNNIFIDVYSK